MWLMTTRKSLSVRPVALFSISALSMHLAIPFSQSGSPESLKKMRRASARQAMRNKVYRRFFTEWGPVPLQVPLCNAAPGQEGMGAEV